MKVKFKPIRFYCLVMTLLLFWNTVYSATAFAKDDHTGQTASLTVVDQDGNTYLQEAEFQLYRVATILDDGCFQIEASFKDSKVSLAADTPAESSEESWSARAVTLESYIVEREADNSPITPIASGKTNEKGRITFSGLSEGVYLLVGKQLTVGQKVYTPLATLISLPYLENNITKNYNPDIQVKNSTKEDENPSEPTYIDLSVLKVWKDEGYDKQRPSEVTVTLYRDKEEYSTVKLNAENNWKYTWSVPEDTSRWQLTEKNIPANYTVTSVQDGKTFIVTNTYKTSTPGKSATSSQSKLPQTGQLWWPISLLSICGLAMFLIGIKIRKKGNSQHEAE